VDDNNSCTDTTTYVNTPGIINVLANDTLFPAQDTTVVIATKPDHGTATVNANFTITFMPDSGFKGSDNLVYQLCESVGAQTKCDTASVCIDVVDTVAACFFPNGFSPNGDGVNDFFTFPCTDKYPNASITVFNRWGDRIWESNGGYKNDWNGTNLKGTPVPDGTYYFIYKYNDGSNKSEARFVVVNR
jgi:gliding motility-associated-like protein